MLAIAKPIRRIGALWRVPDNVESTGEYGEADAYPLVEVPDAATATALSLKPAHPWPAKLRRLH